MSVVVAFKYKDGIIVGADKRVTIYGRLHEDTVSKISQTKYSGHVIGTVGYYRHGNLVAVKDEFMDYRDILEGTTVDYSYVIGNIVPSMMDYYKANNALESADGFCISGSESLYVTKEKIFRISTDFSVIEYDQWAAIGCGMEMVMGLLSNVEEDEFKKMKEKDAISLMGSCITYACDKDSMVSPNFEYILVK